MTEQPAPDQARPPVRIERDGVVATVVIDRPSALNALSPDVLRAVADAFAELEAEGGAVRGVIVVGEGGRAFVAGADIRSLAELTPEEGAEAARLGHSVAAASSAKPSISHSSPSQSMPSLAGEANNA